jgi:glyoxylase-like metal-dependent hydrolase (beta-lactamase superfamily II)
MNSPPDRGLVITTLVTGHLENNVWIASCPLTDEAVIIDAADEADRILAAVRGFRVTAVLTTHGHADHHGAAPAVCEALDVPFRIHSLDAPMAGIEPFLPIVDGERIEVGEEVLTAMHTLGHTPGSVCFTTGSTLFSGDTLFPGGPGATADPERFEEIMTSLETHLFTLPDDTRVLPGHGRSTTIGEERPSVPEWWDRGY